jgi:hypothetical protein
MSLEVLVLDSVGSCVDTESIVYPMNVDNTPDVHNGSHIDDVVDEWWDNLSPEDLTLLTNWLVKHNVDCLIDSNEYTDEELMELEFISKYESGEYTDLDELL